MCFPCTIAPTAFLKICLILLAHPTRFERVTFAFGGQRSIQLSYGCIGVHLADCFAIGNVPAGPKKRLCNPRNRTHYSLCSSLRGGTTSLKVSKLFHAGSTGGTPA